MHGLYKFVICCLRVIFQYEFQLNFIVRLHLSLVKSNDLLLKLAKKPANFSNSGRVGLGETQKQPPELFYKKSVFENFAKSTGKHLCQSLFFNKVAAATLLKERLWHRFFPVNFEKFLRTPFLQNTSKKLHPQTWF